MRIRIVTPPPFHYLSPQNYSALVGIELTVRCPEGFPPTYYLQTHTYYVELEELLPQLAANMGPAFGLMQDLQRLQRLLQNMKADEKLRGQRLLIPIDSENCVVVKK